MAIKIGIRPTIDGREGEFSIRAGLEAQTMDMARAAAKLIEDNVRDKDGNPVQCVIADSTIGGVYEASQCDEKLAREGVCASLTVTPGATAARRWIWISSALKPCGALTAPNGRVRCILRQC